MHPTLFDLSLFGRVFAIDTHGVCVTLGALAGLLLAVCLGRDSDMSAAELRDLGLELILVGLVGARLTFVAAHLPTFVSECRAADYDALSTCTRALWLWHSGLYFYGGLVAAIVWLAWRAPQRGMSMLALADPFAAGLALATTIARLGCYFAGCCFGKMTTGPFGVRFGDDSVAFQTLADLGVISPMADSTPPLHPVQLYDAAGHALLCLGLYLYGRKLGARRNGQLLAIFLGGHALLRIAFDPLRANVGRSWPFSAALLVAAVIVARASRRR